jgi:ATP-dependent Zn protease
VLLSQHHQISLAILALLPVFLIYLEHTLWARPRTNRALKFLVFAIAAALGLRASYELVLVAAARPFDSDLAIALFTHFPLALFLCLATWQGGVVSRSSGKSGGAGSLVEGVDGGGELPAPQNEAVESLGWEDLIVGREVKRELATVVELLKNPSSASRYGIDVPKGILLYGPPGTGKTTIAKVMANQAGLSFFALRADQVISKYVGDSEKNLSKLFAAAEKHSPSVVFIDEVDSIAAQRASGQQQWADRVLNHLLQLMDGVLKTEGIYIIAATNRPDLVDPALTRAGRLSRSIEIPLPDEAARRALLELYSSKLQLESGLDLPSLAKQLDGVSPADIRELCNRAGMNAYQREAGLGKKQRSYIVSKKDFLTALTEVLAE